MSARKGNGGGAPRICIIGAGPCGLTALKNVLAGGFRDVVCYDESDAIGGNWVFREQTDRMSVYESTHIISSKNRSGFDDFPMPPDFPDFPSHQQLRAYFESYADAFGLRAHLRLRTRVTQAQSTAGGGWSVLHDGPDGRGEGLFDYLLVCSGHHREPFIPRLAGDFTGRSLHSCAYRRPEPFRGQDVLVVGAGNSACDIAVDLSRVARRTAISFRRATYIMPKIFFGQTVDSFYAQLRFLPKSVRPTAVRIMLQRYIGPHEWYGLERPAGTPLETHPTLNSSILEAFRHGRIQPRVGIDHIDGGEVHFTDGRKERFDAIIWGTGFRMSFPFLPASVVDWDTTRSPPLYLKMMHRSLPSIFFIGLFQPIGCIWNLADHQARIAVAQITGRLARPIDIADRIAHEMSSPHWRFDSSPRHAIEVDAHEFRRELLQELAPASRRRQRWTFARGA
jgi:Flavin-binding monooxygenase-like